MMRQDYTRRLTYLPGGGLSVAAGPWPVSGNWWEVAGETCVAAYQAKGAADLASSYTNLANPGTYDITTPDAPTWNSTNGWIFNGSSDRLYTGVTPENDQTWSALIRFSNITTNNGVIMGIQAGTPNRWFGFEPIRLTTNVSYRNGSFLQIAGQMTSGVMAVGGNVAYRNGSAESGTISSVTGDDWLLGEGGINIGRNGGTSPGQYCAGYVQAVAIYSTTLDATQIATVSAAMAAL